MRMHREVPSAWLQSLSDTQDSHTPCDPMAVFVQARVTGLHVLPLQSSSSLVGVQARQALLKQYGEFVRCAQCALVVQLAQLLLTHCEAVVLRQSKLLVFTRHWTHWRLALQRGVGEPSPQSALSFSSSQATHAPVPRLQEGSVG